MHLAVKNLVKKDSPDKNMAGKGIRKKRICAMIGNGERREIWTMNLSRES